MKTPNGTIDINPWQAILDEVKRAAYRVAWIDERIVQELEQEHAYLNNLEVIGADPTELEAARQKVGREVRAWLAESREERKLMMNTSTKAVSLGLSERYLESVRAEAQLIAKVLSRALQAADVTEEQRELAMAELRLALGDVSRELRARNGSMALPVRSEMA